MSIFTSEIRRLIFCILCGIVPQYDLMARDYFNTIGIPQKQVQEDSLSQDTITEENEDTAYITDNIPLIMAMPLKQVVVSSPFGMRWDPMNRRKRRMHNGLDLKARFESVYSMLPGTVEEASYSEKGGYYVTVNYGNCTCSYLHLSKILVKKGQRLQAGQKLGVSGNTGTRTTGPHLHISCRWKDTGKYFDPRILLKLISQENNKHNKI